MKSRKNATIPNRDTLLEMATCVVVTGTIWSRRSFINPCLPIDPPSLTLAAGWSMDLLPSTPRRPKLSTAEVLLPMSRSCLPTMGSMSFNFDHARALRKKKTTETHYCLLAFAAPRRWSAWDQSGTCCGRLCRRLIAQVSSGGLRSKWNPWVCMGIGSSRRVESNIYICVCAC